MSGPLFAAGLFAAVALTPPSTSVTPGPTESATVEPIEASTLHVIGCLGCDLEGLIAALKLRLPATLWQPMVAGEALPRAAAVLRVFAADLATTVVQVELESREIFQLKVPIALSDARATRELATTLANLLAGIADGSARPVDATELIAAPIEIQAPLLVAPPMEAVTMVPPTSVAEPTPAPAQPKAAPVPTLAVSRWIVDLAGITLQGAGNPTFWRGAGGHLGVRYCWAHHVYAWASVRYIAAPADYAQVSRARMALGVGYRRESATWTLLAEVAASVEPWALPGTNPRLRTKPLFGGFLQLAGLRTVYRSNNSLHRLLLGPQGSASLSGEIDNGFARVRIRPNVNEPVVAALGGFEWSVGLALAYRWAHLRGRQI